MIRGWDVERVVVTGYVRRFMRFDLSVSSTVDATWRYRATKPGEPALFDADFPSAEAAANAAMIRVRMLVAERRAARGNVRRKRRTPRRKSR